VPDLAGIARRDGQFSRCWEFLVKKKGEKRETL
jgi:hypothetical protein